MTVRSDPYGSSNIIASPLGDIVAEGGGSGELSGSAPVATARQLALNYAYAHYRCTHYDACKMDWNGHPVGTHVEHDAIASQGYLPPGFTDSGGKALPLKFRRPTAPFYLPRVVVNKYTSLLFGEERCPSVSVVGDPARESFLRAIASEGDLWVQMKRARALGGSMGSVAVGFELSHGRPLFTVYDPRWCLPEFADKGRQVLESLEIKYPYFEVVNDPVHGPVTLWFWYRRKIDTISDRIWEKVPIFIDQQEPNWGAYEMKMALHHAGRVPAVWIQNEHVEDSIDGDPDCHGAFELVTQYDTLMSQANRGIIANCDPTRVIQSDSDFDNDLEFGSNAAIQVEKGGNVAYLELNGTGPRAAREQANDIRERIYEMVSYIPDDPKQAQQTAFEVSARFAQMLGRADDFRVTYGKAVKTLLEIALKVCTTATQPRVDPESGDLVQGVLNLPERFDEETQTWIKEAPGSGGRAGLSWPPYFKPTLDEIQKAATAMSSLVTSQILTPKDAADFMRKYMPLRPTDVIEKEIADAAAAEAGAADSGLRAGAKGGLGIKA